MSLIQCPECEATVSDQARACPQCGMPLKSSFSGWFSEAWGLGLHNAQKGALAYPVTWGVTVLISMARRGELSNVAGILPSFLLWLLVTAVVGFALSALAAWGLAWLRGWLGRKTPREAWRWSNHAVAVTWFCFAAWMILSMR